MITQLTIQNFGLIDSISIEFSKGLNILTGETGAGKSILIDGLRFALGERMNPHLVRNPEAACVVEAVLELPGQFLDEYKPVGEFLTDSDKSLIIQRSYLPDGRTRIKINGFSVTVTQLKELGNHLVDFHGPGDHQLLFCASEHITILDRLTDLAGDMSLYSRKYQEYLSFTRELAELEQMSRSRQADSELLEHQIRELSQIPLDEESDNEINEKQKRLNNAAKLHECASGILNILENDELGVSGALSRAFSQMNQLNRIDQSTVGFAQTLGRIQEETNQILLELREYIEKLSFEPQEAAEINRLSDAYYEIKRKYGPAINDARKFYEQAKEKLGLLANFEENSKGLSGKISASEAELKQIAALITKKRKTSSLALKKTIEKELKELGIMHVEFECRISKTSLKPDGQDEVIFYISPNAGEELKPLAEIVSSGEAARVMLALKKALIKVDPIPVLIFDEIDAQIAGRLGTVTGEKLKELSRDRQVILITHLPQIASFADTHFKVVKKVERNHTTTSVERLDSQNKVRELAKMMSGEKESQIALTHAEEMLAKAGKTSLKRELSK